MVVSKNGLGSVDGSFFVEASATFPIASGLVGNIFLQGLESEVTIATISSKDGQTSVKINVACFPDSTGTEYEYDEVLVLVRSHQIYNCTGCCL